MDFEGKRAYVFDLEKILTFIWRDLNLGLVALPMLRELENWTRKREQNLIEKQSIP